MTKATRKFTIRNPEAFLARQRKGAATRAEQLRGTTPPNANTPDKFWSHVAKSDGCWEWQGFRTPRGYGELSIGGKKHRAHRYSWSLAHGDIPAGLVVCHRCDNPRCVRPDHLFIGTQIDNMQDAKTKGIAYRPGQHNDQRSKETGRWLKKQK